jgi:hypothetical protein
MTSKSSALESLDHKALPQKLAQRGEDLMYHYKEMVEFAAALDMKMAVVQVQPGESNNEAWNRHLKDHPHDVHAMIKVFNQPKRVSRVSCA